MKKFLGIIAIISVVAISCAKSSDIDNLQKQIDNLKSIEIASIQRQIATADSTLVVMQDVESLLSEFITSLRTALGAINGDYNSLNEAVAALQDKEELFGGSISSLRQTLSEGATDVKKWVEDSYATMQAFNALQENVSDINTSIRTIFSRLDSLDVSSRKIADDLRDAKTSLTADLGRCQEDIESIKSDLQRMQGEIDSIKAEMAKIVASVQSVVVVPDYKDGSVRMTSGVSNVLRFEVYPLSAASNLATLGASALSLDCVETQTKAGLLTNIPITEVSFNGEVLLVTADGSALADDIKTGRTTVSARLRISDGTVTRSSEYFGLWYGKDLSFELLPVSEISWSYAKLRARINIEKAENDNVFYGFLYSKSEDGIFTNSTSLATRVIDSDGVIECQTDFLVDETEYYYRAFVSKNGLLNYSPIGTFTTDSIPEIVDLGLSVKWRSWNVGASKPEEYGGYYAWGETETKEDYSWSTYKWCNGSSSTLTKYNTESSYGTVDNKTVLDSEDDAARANLGGKWRMPTDAEWTELINDCTLTITYNYNDTGVVGLIATSKKTGYTTKSIFFPHAGRMYNTVLRYEGNCYYWSSAYVHSFGSSDSVSIITSRQRYEGLSVRPVSE